MKKTLFGSMLALLPVMLAAQPVLSDNLENTASQWKNLEAHHFAAGQGRNNSVALAGERVRGRENQSRTFRRVIPGLEAGKKYRFTGFLKIESGLLPEDIRFGVETRSNPGRKWVGYTFASAKGTDGQWVKMQGEFSTAAQMKAGVTGYDYEIIVYIKNGKYGKFYLDDIAVEPAGAAPAASAAVAAAAPASKLKDPNDPDNVVLNAGFEFGIDGWRNLKPEAIAAGEGIGGSTALCVERDAKNHGHIFRNRMILEPCTKYEFGGRIRLAPGTQANQVRFGVEARSNPGFKWGGYTFAAQKSQDGQWLDFRGEITTFADNGGGTSYVYEFIIYVNNNTVGKFFVDNVFLKKKGTADMPKIPTAVNYPAGGILSADGCEVMITSASGTENGPGSWKITGADGKTVREGKTTFVNRTVKIRTGELAPGVYRIAIASEAEKSDYSLRNSLQLVVRPKRSSCVIDEYGRTLFNGKPYMPLGFFIYGMPDEHLAIFKGTPFNTLMSYATWKSDLDLDRVMSILEAQDMKLILSLKDFFDLPKSGGMLAVKEYKGISGPDNIVRHLVEKYRNHPALLAYYICDERPVSDWKFYIDRKDMINQLDPDHPTFAVHCTPGAFSGYSCWQDVFGCDPYPIEKNTRHMRPVTDHVQAAQKVAIYPKGVGFWMVPQYFNWAGYQSGITPAEAYEKFRWPTETETLAACVMGAIHGARGFLFFNFSDMFRPADPVKFEQTWPVILRVGNILKQLEPWIMSVTPPEMLTPTDVKGRIFAAKFTDADGRICIMIAAEGPGEAQAVITAPAGLKPLCGRTLFADGKYKFNGSDITCDILIGE
ncbi:MAG: hypothetical protein IKC94_02720 [Lentisphaeria bacterium]|nr:hypothetical protein [Lentisphaeria bacterium]